MESNIRVARQLAEKVSNHLVYSKSLLKTVIKSQLVSPSHKCLTIEADNFSLSIYSAEGKIYKINNSNNQHGLEALDGLQIKELIYSENILSECIEIETTISLRSIMKALDAIPDPNFKRSLNCESACYINNANRVVKVHSELNIPNKDIINYIKKVMQVFPVTKESEFKLEMNFSMNTEDLKVVLVSEEDFILATVHQVES